MSTSHEIAMAGAGGLTPPATVKVWDLFVRSFHWSVVVLFAIAYVTGDEVQRMHIIAGYVVAALVAMRIVWGFVGPRHARFADFVRPPREVLTYLRDVLLLRARHYIGHNPAGGLMVVALLVMLTVTSVSGYLMTTDAYWGSKAVEEIHGALANATVALIVLHVLGVLIASFQHRENLVKAMVSGLKRPQADSSRVDG
jgi:cytochrome b